MFSQDLFAKTVINIKIQFVQNAKEHTKIERNIEGKNIQKLF